MPASRTTTFPTHTAADAPEASRPLLEGIAVDRSGSRLFVSRSFEQVLVELDASTLTVVDTLHVPQVTNTLEGLAIAPDEELLYVVSKFLDLWLVDIEAFETVAFLEGLASGQYYLEALSGRRVYSSGNGHLTLIDGRNGTVIAQLEPAGGGETNHFAISTSGDRIAVILQKSSPFRWQLALTDVQLNEIGQTDETDLFFEHVAWSPSGDRIYVRYGGNDRPGGRGSNRCGILSLDPMSLDVIEDVPLAIDGGCMALESGRGVANPVASTPDGRFLVFPAPAGAYVFDTVVDRPVARTPSSTVGRTSNFCCDVAASPDDDVFYVAGTDGWVTKFRFIRGN